MFWGRGGGWLPQRNFNKLKVLFHRQALLQIFVPADHFNGGRFSALGVFRGMRALSVGEVLPSKT